MGIHLVTVTWVSLSPRVVDHLVCLVQIFFRPCLGLKSERAATICINRSKLVRWAYPPIFRRWARKRVKTQKDRSLLQNDSGEIHGVYSAAVPKTVVRTFGRILRHPGYT